MGHVLLSFICSSFVHKYLQYFDFLFSIQDGNKESTLQIMTVSTDRVFTPPESVTKNIEKPGIVRKAKVVSAVNADDRNAAFEGSKRVR